MKSLDKEPERTESNGQIDLLKCVLEVARVVFLSRTSSVTSYNENLVSILVEINVTNDFGGKTIDSSFRPVSLLYLHRKVHNEITKRFNGDLRPTIWFCR